MKNDLVTVLDLGSSKVTCLAARSANGGVAVEAIATAPCKGIKRGVLSDLEETAKSIDIAVRRVQQDTGTEISQLIVGVSGPHIEGMNAQGLKPIVPRGRQITHQDVLEVVTHSRSIVLPPDREQIQALPREFRVDGVRDVRQPIGMSAARLEVVTYIGSGQTAVIQNIERAVTMAGKKVEQMMLRPLASGIGVLTQEEMDLGAVVVDLGAGCTDVAIFTGGSLTYCVSLPVGAQHITSDISKLLKTSPDEAERLKVEFGSALAKDVPERSSVDVTQIGQTQSRPLQRRVLSEIIEARLREIAVMVRQQIEKSGLLGLLPGGVILTGGGAQLHNSAKLFDEVLKHMKVRVAEPDILLAGVPNVGMAASVGMARFAIQCYEEITPANGTPGWRDKVRSLFSVISGK